MSIPQGGQLHPTHGAAENYNFSFKDAVSEYMMTGDIKPPQDNQGKIQLTDGQSRNVESLKGKPVNDKISEVSSKL